MLAMGKPTWSSQLLWSLLEHNFGTTRTYCAVRRAPRGIEGNIQKVMHVPARSREIGVEAVRFCQCTNVRHAICCVFVSSLLFVLICGFVFNIPLHGLCHVFFLLVHIDINVISASLYHGSCKLIDMSWPNYVNACFTFVHTWCFWCFMIHCLLNVLVHACHVWVVVALPFVVS